MSVYQVIYASQPFGFDEPILNGILVQSRRNNPAAEVTGCLICRGDLYLQLLEGPQAGVEAIYARILKDPRHLDVVRLVAAPVVERMFPDWAMRDDPARSWMWTQAQVERGSVERASPAEVRAVFKRVAAEVADAA